MTATIEAPARPLNLFDPASFADGPPHDFFDFIREEDPAHRTDDPQCGTIWSLTRQADIRKASTNTTRFTSARGVMYPIYAAAGAHFDNQMLYHSGPRHARLRGLVQSALTPRIVSRFDGWIRGICADIIRDISGQRHFDAVPAMAAELPAQVIASILGVPKDGRANFLRWATAVFGRNDPAIGVQGFLDARAAVYAYALELGEMKRRAPAADLTTELLSAAPGGEPITQGEFQETVFMMMLAGFETTHTLIAQSLLLIARDANARAQVQARIATEAHGVVDELLRWTSPVMHMARTVCEDFDLHGKRIRTGDHIIMWYVAANRDPRVHVDPHRFDVTRDQGSGQMAFGGGGIHYCLGAPLARMEAEILLQELARAGIWLNLDGEPERSVDVSINALRCLPMRIA